MFNNRHSGVRNSINTIKNSFDNKRLFQKKLDEG